MGLLFHESFPMRYNCKAVDADAQIARNREIIQALPAARVSALTWNPQRLRYDLDEANLDLFAEMFNA